MLLYQPQSHFAIEQIPFKTKGVKKTFAICFDISTLFANCELLRRKRSKLLGSELQIWTFELALGAVLRFCLLIGGF